MKKVITIIFIFINLYSFAQVHERWNVKTVTDGFIPNFNNLKKITVAQIEPKPKIPVRNTQPRLNIEKQMVAISGTVSRVALESDGDYHIEITDNSMADSSFVCEAVNPGLPVAATSPMVTKFRSVYTVARKLKVGDTVKFTGLLFQDKYHSPSPHRTRNFVEMHPILMVTKQ